MLNTCCDFISNNPKIILGLILFLIFIILYFYYKLYGFKIPFLSSKTEVDGPVKPNEVKNIVSNKNENVMEKKQKSNEDRSIDHTEHTGPKKQYDNDIIKLVNDINNKSV